MLIEDTDFREEVLDLGNPFDVKLVSEFLGSLDFSFHPESVHYTVLLYNLNGDVIGTGSSQKNVLKYVAVAPKFRETTAFAKIISHLTERLVVDYSSIFVFTKPRNVVVFKGLGFKHIATAEPLFSLLEYGMKGIRAYQNQLKKYKKLHASRDIASMVVNCNPFTNGHKYLIEKAASENEWLYLFVVEEDFSVFPFDVRWELIKKGLAHLDNVVMIPGGDYIVSGKTFPYYFLKGIDEDERIARQGELDVDIFRNYITPVLGINKRYVGSENYCKTTAAYNTAMRKLLPEKGIELIEVERKCQTANHHEQFISASKVRQAIREDNLDEYSNFLPENTLKFLYSGAADVIIKAIKSSDSTNSL
jgi:[citrate (pro-3S)-lyase] ligase